MNTKNQRTILIIIASVIGAMVLIGFALWYFSAGDGGVTPQSKESVKVDPITGETIIETEGIDPEGKAKPSILGASNIQPLYGDDYAFSAVSEDVLLHHFETSKYIKISPNNIKKDSVNIPETGERYLVLDFDVYLDDNTKDKHRVSTKFQSDGIIYATVTAPDGKVTNYTTSVFGGDVH